MFTVLHGRRWLLALGVFGLLATSLVPTDVHGSVTPTAAFDWSMPARLVDADGDGFIDHYFDGSHAPETIEPTGWTVNFDACDSQPVGTPISHYRWRIDGSFVTDQTTCDGFSHVFPEEGVYWVDLTVTDEDGRQHTMEQRVVVQDWLIVSLGDSYGSGEGNPDNPIPTGLFDDLQAARSDFQNAVSDLEDAASDLTAVRAAWQPVLNALAVAQDRLNARDARRATRNNLCNPVLHPELLLPFHPDHDAAVQACDNAQATVNSANLAYANALANLALAWVAAGQAELAAGYDSASWAFMSSVANAALAAGEAAVNVANAAVTDTTDILQDIEGALVPQWQDARCHRSAIAGSAQAALAIEQADPRTSVTFIHLACSGAKIAEGLLEGYEGAEPPGSGLDLPPQVEAMMALIGNREVDALYMSIGGNDANFSPVIQACIEQIECYTDTWVEESWDALIGLLCAVAPFPDPIQPFTITIFPPPCFFQTQQYLNPEPATGFDLQRDGIALIPGRYASLAAELGSVLPEMPDTRVFISEVPNVAQRDDGDYCPDPADGPIASLPGITSEEWHWADTVFAGQLNDAIGDASSLHGWTLIDGLYDAFATHGYCAQDHWIVRIQETFPIQRNISGTVHPNQLGHAAYKEHIAAALHAAFYPTDNLSEPRAPGYLPTATAGCEDLITSSYGTSPADRQFVDLTNANTAETLSLDGCAFVAYNAFTERSIGAATLALSGTLAPGATLRIGSAGVAGVDVAIPDGALPAGPGAFAVSNGPPPAAGTPVSKVLPSAVTGTVYLNSTIIFGVNHNHRPEHNAIYQCIYGGYGTGPFAGPFAPLEECLPGL